MSHRRAVRFRWRRAYPWSGSHQEFLRRPSNLFLGSSPGPSLARSLSHPERFRAMQALVYFTTSVGFVLWLRVPAVPVIVNG